MYFSIVRIEQIVELCMCTIVIINRLNLGKLRTERYLYTNSAAKQRGGKWARSHDSSVERRLSATTADMEKGIAQLMPNSNPPA